MDELKIRPRWYEYNLRSNLFETVYNASLNTDAGWSSLVARRAHNPKVVGSNPAPATKY